MPENAFCWHSQISGGNYDLLTIKKQIKIHREFIWNFNQKVISQIGNDITLPGALKIPWTLFNRACFNLWRRFAFKETALKKDRQMTSKFKKLN